MLLKILSNGIPWRMMRVMKSRVPEKSKIFRIIFICSGNVCRSPMAEASLRYRLPAELKERVAISSAGISTLSGLAPTVEAELAARMKGYNMSQHRSKSASEAALDEADLILCMENNHVKAILSHLPRIADRVHLLTGFKSKRSDDIPDPYGRDIQSYKDILNLIDAELDRVASAIWKMARKKQI
jgi:protein-tyrosine-phosphatase